MCDTRSKRHKNHQHPCQIKIFKCRLHELCIFSFIFYCTTCGVFCNAYHLPVNTTDLYEDLKTRSTPVKDGQPDNGAEAEIVTSQLTVTTASISVQGVNPDDSIATAATRRNDHPKEMMRCDDSGCYVKISSSKQALENMMAASLQLYQNYANVDGSEERMTEESLKNLLQDLQPKEKVPETSHNHENENESPAHDHETESPVEDDHDHEKGISAHGHDHKSENLSEEQISERAIDNEIWNSLIDYFSGISLEVNTTEDKIPCYKSVKDLTEAYFESTERLQLSFGDFLSILPQIILDITRPGCEESHHDDNTQDKSAIKLNTKIVWLISFASVAIISVVSLCGVLTIPVLRYSKILNHLIAYLVALAVGTLCGDALLHLLPRAFGLHDHGSGSHNEANHFDIMWKGLVVCAGIYFFFLLETIMEFIHRRKKNSSSLGKHSHCHSNHEEHDCDAESTNSDDNQRLKQGNSIATPSESPLLKKNDGKQEEIHITPLINGGDACNHGEHDSKPDGHRLANKFDEEPLDTGHHHHHHSNEVPKTIASLAWMVIVGDGLHNITDGLAIGAAFTSSIGAGLGTALAIFCHEIPQELADFAVLLNAGMTAKQALFWNFLSACMCFVGLVVGLLVGEYTNGIIMWILAFTAGGFLYIALVDMLPALMKQLSQKGYKLRYLIQNVGMISGFGLMVLIALKEESFEGYFQN